MMRRLLVLLLTFVVAAAALAGGAARAHDPVLGGIDREFDCYNFVPHAPSHLDSTRPARIAIALDDVSEARARHVMQRVQAVYAGAQTGSAATDVRFDVVDVHAHAFVKTAVDGFYTEGRALGDDLMSELIQHYRTEHPDLVRDHVHLMTTKDIRVGSNKSVAGIANCIGSIGQPGVSWSIGEIGVLAPVTFLGFAMLDDVDSKVAAHELGHAFGAQHHYANCVEAAPFAPLGSNGDVCTLMFNDVSTQAMRFGTAEAAAIRGTAQAHLK